jgi:calcium/calmodulin-dependent protein kinase I
VLAGFSKVRLATERATGEQWACKIISLPRLGGKTRFMSRAAIMKASKAAPLAVQAGSHLSLIAQTPMKPSHVSLCAPPERLHACAFQEIDVLLDLDHPSVVGLREYYVHFQKDRVYLIMELLQGEPVAGG